MSAIFHHIYTNTMRKIVSMSVNDLVVKVNRVDIMYIPIVYLK